MLHIERIEIAGPDKRARRLYFTGIEEPRTTSAQVVRVLGLEADTHHDESTLVADIDQAEQEQARERALRLLGHRERSVSELRTRLIDDGYPVALAGEIVARYQEVELLDDARFAGMFARTRAAAGYGRRRILDELTRKGIDPQIASASVDEALGGDEVERARDVLRGKVPRDRKERDKLIRKLVTRGFSMSAALSAVEQPAQDDVDEGDR